MIPLFLSSALLLGWSLGANDAANVFGTAVATGMVRFRTAAIFCGVFVILGAVISGAGTTDTLGQLGAVNALGGSFMVALAAALAVMWMTKAGLPVSVSQAIVGAILGWNIFTGSQTDINSLVKIVSTWVICPLLAAGFAAVFYLLARRIITRWSVHLLELDAMTRTGLIAAGAFGAYSLGANNIANVMGAFVPAFPARSIDIAGLPTVDSTQLLFFVGGLAIAVGVLSYSRRVMMTVGKGLFQLTPVTALVVVLAEAIVLFLFASQSLESWLLSHGLPAIPLVPVSSSQAVIGAVIGIAVAKGGRGVRYSALGRVAGGWIVTPVIAAALAFLGLFFLQNVFGLIVARPVPYQISRAVIERLSGEGLTGASLERLQGDRYENARAFKGALADSTDLTGDDVYLVMEFAERDSFDIAPRLIAGLESSRLTVGQADALRALERKSFAHAWQLREALVNESGEWAMLPDTWENREHNRIVRNKLRHVCDTFRVRNLQGRGRSALPRA
ncbi:MAG: inorganic phosphate transporter [Candidatus Eisenbacteria bacterium]